MGAVDAAAVLHERVEVWVSGQVISQPEAGCAPPTALWVAITQLDDLIAERLNQTEASRPETAFDEADWRSLMEREPMGMDR